ncbi:MAG: MBL fold metallo-hydrolase [Candidatus Merdivicinus sp.]
MFFYNLCSSSRGNSSFLGDFSGGILFDVGIGIRNFAKALSYAEIAPEKIQAIFVSHEHTDHVQGLKAISHRYNIPIYGSRGTLESLVQSGILTGNEPINVLDSPVEAGGFLVTPFATPHDSAESIGFHIDSPAGKSIAICTDLGYASETVMQGISGCDFVMLESNYDRKMLLNGEYPPFLKQRVNSRSGHLSNEQCAQMLEQLISSGTTQAVLAHLSEHNNRPELAHTYSADYLAQRGIQENIDYQIDVLPRFTVGRRYEIA